MQTNVYTVWGNCKDLLTEKKFLAYQHSEIQDRNRMALLVGGFTILLVGLSDFLRTNHQLFLTISITIRILFFLFCLFYFVTWKKKQTIQSIYTTSFIFSLFVGISINAFIYLLNPDKIIEIIDLLTIPITFILVYVFVIIPVYLLLISGLVTSILYIIILSQFTNIDTSTIIILSIILVTIHAMGFYINRFLSKVRRNEFFRIQEIKILNIELHEEIEERKTVQEKLQKTYSEITESLYYASNLQVSLLPDLKITKKYISDYFVLYAPCDIISGDFYWATIYNDKVIVTAADCTGHGIRAGFMSFMAITLLDDIVHVKGITKASEILDNLREHVIKNLHQTPENTDLRDGLDIALCVIDTENMVLEYAGAFNPLLHIRNHQMVEYKADRMPISFYIAAKPHFTNHTIPLEKGDKIYIYSDGYADQFGGEKNKKFTHKRLKREILISSKLPMQEQYELLTYLHIQWKGKHKRTDDVLLLGIEI
jgi:serine phosphatase RsbU (regulator of sigma subunit)